MRISFACWKSPPYVVDLFLLHQVNAFASAVPLSSANGVAIGGCRLLRASPPLGGSLLLVTDIHIMGLPLSITNRISCKGAPSSKDSLNRKWDSFIESPPLKKRIEFASVASPSPNENGFADQGSTSPSEWDSHRDGHPLSSKRFLASETTRGILRLHKWSVERETPIQKGSLASPSHHGRLRLQVDNVHN